MQLAERELELRRVKQREYAEQQLRVEAEEAAVRARRGHRAERDRWRRRVEEAQAAAQYAEEQRDALAARLAMVNESCERLREGVVALQGVAAELRTTFELEHRAAQARIRELEGELERARADPPAEQRSGGRGGPAARGDGGGARRRRRAPACPRGAVCHPSLPQAGGRCARWARCLGGEHPAAPGGPCAPWAERRPTPSRSAPARRRSPRVSWCLACSSRPGGCARSPAGRVAARLAAWAGRAQEPPRS